MYNENIIERLSNLKYVGKLKQYNACGMSDKKFDENDKVKLFLNISKEGIIQNASFKAVGCTGVLVSASFICEMLEDKDLKFARKLDVIAVNRYMGSDYSVIKQHAILVVLNALLNTIKAYDKAVSLGTVTYYAKLVEKPKKVKTVSAKPVTQKETKVEKKEVKVAKQELKETKEDVVSTKVQKAESTIVDESKEEAKENKTKAKKASKKEVSVKVVDDTVIVEENDVKSESKENKSKGLLNLLSNIKKDKKVETVEENKAQETKTEKVKESNQISFDFNELGTEKAPKAKKVKPKKEKAEKSAKNKKAKIVNPLATTYADEDEKISAPTPVETMEVVPVEDNNVIVEDVVEEPVVTKTVRTKTTKTTTKTVVAKVNDNVAVEHAANTYEAQAETQEVNGEVSKSQSIEKMNSSLLRLQNLQKKAVVETDSVVVEKEEPSTSQASLDKLKALVASAKQSGKPVASKQPVKAAPKKEVKKVEVQKEQPKTQGKSVKYVRIDEFQEKTKKEKKGLFSRIFNRK